MINKKIKNLTKFFLSDYWQRLNILKDNKINKKSPLVWMLIILAFGLTYISVYIIDKLNKIGVPEIGLKIYLILMSIIMIFQLIIMIINLFYYSKDLEYILPLPVKPIEILISKLYTIIGIMYLMEILFLIIPLISYCLLVDGSIRFIINSVILLITFPLFNVLIISSIVIILMKIFSKLKNEHIKQIIIISILTIFLILIIYNIFNNYLQKINNLDNINIINQKLDEINKYFIILNPMVKLLIETKILFNIFNIIEIFFIELILLIIFYIIGKKFYINNLLEINNNKKIKKNKKLKYKKNKKEIRYLKNEFKKISKNIEYFIQIIYNYINIVIITLLLLYTIIPKIVKELENYNVESFIIQIFATVLIIIQILETFNNLAITSISKDGKDAIIMKYIPISLYKQFIIKTIPQITINTFMIISILYVISLTIPPISLGYYFAVFITATNLNVIYTYFMLLLDCINPNFNWTNQNSVLKNNKNNIYKYFITLIIILILLYFSKIFLGYNFIISIIIINLIFVIILFLLNKIIKKNINKIFNKIY